jgi:hypothetical protein
MGLWLLALLLAVMHAREVHRRIMRTQPNASIEPRALRGVFLSHGWRIAVFPLIAAGLAAIATGSDIVQRLVTRPGLF